MSLHPRAKWACRKKASTCHRVITVHDVSKSHASLVLGRCLLVSLFTGNMFPSVGSDNKSPFKRLYGKKPEYSDLRVIGSACYPCLRPHVSHKLDPRSLQCVFVGYSSQY